MNYYEDVLERINGFINKEEYEEAKRLILNELDVPYVPKDFEDRLKELLSFINEKTFKVNVLSDEDIEKYLYMDENHQLIAVDELNRKNLRDYIEICNRYLKSNCFINGKVLLIDSLIKQEINYEFECMKNNEIIRFNPSEIDPIEKSSGYLSCLNALRERFMKEPSMLYMAEQLLYKEAIMALPFNIDKDNGIKLADKIETYIKDAFK